MRISTDFECYLSSVSLVIFFRVLGHSELTVYAFPFTDWIPDPVHNSLHKAGQHALRRETENQARNFWREVGHWREVAHWRDRQHD